MTSKDTVRGLRYAGANWLERQGHELSDLGHLVANIIGQAVLGIYHMADRAASNPSERTGESR